MYCEWAEMVSSTFIQLGDDQVSSILRISMNDPEAKFIHSQVQVGVRVQTVDWEATCSCKKSAVHHCTIQQVYLYMIETNGKRLISAVFLQLATVMNMCKQDSFTHGQENS